MSWTRWFAMLIAAYKAPNAPSEVGGPKHPRSREKTEDFLSGKVGNHLFWDVWQKSLKCGTCICTYMIVDICRVYHWCFPNAFVGWRGLVFHLLGVVPRCFSISWIPWHVEPQLKEIFVYWDILGCGFLQISNGKSSTRDIEWRCHLDFKTIP